MTKERQILQMHFDGFSQRDICTALKCGHTRVSNLVEAVRRTDVSREAIAGMDDTDVIDLLTPPKANRRQSYAQPDFEKLAKELERPDVTRKLLWYEYCSDISDDALIPYQYAQFCKLFDNHLAVTKATYRIRHVPGKRMFVDWAGSFGHITSAVTGEVLDIPIFVACLPYSARLYAEGFMDMKQASWTTAHIHAFEYFGGVPAILVPDNTKTATVKAPIYTTLINERYHELANHYGCAVIPARVRKPNDKALVENGVNIVEKSVLAALRNEVFFTLAELNEAVLARIDAINAAPFQRRPDSRDVVFLSEEKSCLRPLPPTRFEPFETRTAKVSADYHVQADTMRYSVPYKLIGQTLGIRMTTGRVEVSHGGEVVAIHERLHGRKGQYSTLKEHMPPAHQAYDAEWTPERFERWADSMGPATRSVIDTVIRSKAIVEQAFVPCMNILNLARRGRRSLLEKACQDVMEHNLACTYSAVKNTMEAMRSKRNGKAKALVGDVAKDKLGSAGMVRGAGYYSNIGGGLQ
jgi:transposase